MNRTPVTGDIHAARDKREINVFGCGLAHTAAEAPKEAHFGICLNITTPYMPITSDGKAPDLKLFLEEIHNVSSAGWRKEESAPARRAAAATTPGRR